jgi:serine/threonine-protein kinase haspin
MYAIIVLAHGGVDLEHFKFENAAKTGWRQAYSLFWQVANALDQAEQKFKFEVSYLNVTQDHRPRLTPRRLQQHRDLHWGQILVRTMQSKDTRDVQVHATIIDFGFSRMDIADSSSRSIKWTEMEEEVFEGTG